MPADSNPKVACPERLKLSNDVTLAIQKSYAAKADFERAAKQKKNTEALASALADARIAERAAIAALDKHRKEHGCAL